MQTHVLQHFDVVNVVGETQRQSRQEGVISSVQQQGFQHDGLSRAESKVRLLAENFKRKTLQRITCKQMK